LFNNLKKKCKPNDWSDFNLEGYSVPVTGFIHSKNNPLENGMAFGGVGTGCIDIECDGTIGFVSAFNSLSPRRGPVNMPMFGISCGSESFLLSTAPLKNYPEDSLNNVQLRRAAPAKDIFYFGHYPMLDMEYITDSPVRVSSRFYTPFFPGDAAGSNTPGGFFEFYIKNPTDRRLEGNLVFSFPGPSAEEARGNLKFKHSVSKHGGAKILTVKNSDKLGYSMGVIADATDSPRFAAGGCLNVDGNYWSHIGHAGTGGGHEYRLPLAYDQPGGSVSAGYDAGPGKTVRITFVLSWYAPFVQSGGAPICGDRGFTDGRTGENNNKEYTHMYAKRYCCPLNVARRLIDSAADIKRRIVAWQSVVYANKIMPGWLKDTLINGLYVITEDSLWVQSKPPVGRWCKNEDGIFAMNECPRGCPQMECIPCSFYGSLPIVYFFPELAVSTLRTFKAYQYEDGATPWVFGGCTVGSAHYELTTPRRGYQVTTNGISYAAMADRAIRYLNDRALLDEFYCSLKRNMIYTMELNTEPDGVISFPNRRASECWNYETEWFEVCGWEGMAAHAGGLHLAQLRILERMAAEKGDTEFLKRVQTWIADGQKSMEEKMWIEAPQKYYLNFKNEKSGNVSDYIFGYQLDGEWIARFHSLPPVFDPARVTETLKTVFNNNVRLSKFGAANYVTPEGELAYEGGGLGIEYNANDFFPPELLMLAMTFMQDGRLSDGLGLAKRCMHEIVCVQGKSFNSPNLIRGDRTQSTFGNDYYQMLMIWALPAVIENKSLEEYGSDGSFVKEIIKAAK